MVSDRIFRIDSSALSRSRAWSMTLLMASRTRNSVEQVEVLMVAVKQQGCRNGQGERIDGVPTVLLPD
jgi:hypothetical protein